jgi:hypothetical protein
MGSSREHRNLKNEIRVALGSLPHVLIFNNESGSTMSDDGDRWISYGVGSGGADLIGICRLPIGIGRWFSLEVKTGNAVLTKKQKLNQNLVMMYGGFAAVVHSVAEAEEAIAQCLIIPEPTASS